MMNIDDKNVAATKPDQTDQTAANTNVQTKAANDDFDDEVLTLPESTESLNRMGMDKIACVGCQ